MGVVLPEGCHTLRNATPGWLKAEAPQNWELHLFGHFRGHVTRVLV